MNLKKKRIEKKYKIKDIARYLQVSDMTVYYYESGKRKVSIVTLKKLAVLYDCSVNELID